MADDPLHAAIAYGFAGAVFSLAMYSIAGHRVAATPIDHFLTGFRVALLWPYFAARLAVRVVRRIKGERR